MSVKEPDLAACVWSLSSLMLVFACLGNSLNVMMTDEHELSVHTDEHMDHDVRDGKDMTSPTITTITAHTHTTTLQKAVSHTHTPYIICSSEVQHCGYSLTSHSQ